MLERFFLYLLKGDEKMSSRRLFLLSGLLSVMIGIFYITTLLDGMLKGLQLWGFFILFWGIAVTWVSLKQLHILMLMKSLAAIGIFLHGSVSVYWILFPNLSAGGHASSLSILFAAPQLMISILCIYILGIKVEKKYDKIN
jgi:hypothetical protein